MATWDAGEIMIEWSLYCGNYQSCKEAISGDCYEGQSPDPTEHSWKKIKGLWYCPKCAAEYQPEPGSYKRTRGILAPADEPAEVSIRRMRDSGKH